MLNSHQSSFSIQNCQAFLYPLNTDNLYTQEMNIKKEISLWIRSSRRVANLSGDELGAKLALELGDAKGHTKANISHWELGRHEPSFRQILAISKITHCQLPIDINSISKVERANPINQDIQAVIDLMNGTDARGRAKALIAVQDALEMHEAHLRKIGQSSVGISDQIERIGSINRKMNKTDFNDDLISDSEPDDARE
jgi:transcriptional regulator with XRE-family HTH domain